METLTIDCQRLRNLTTGRLHTEMSCIYEDLETIAGWGGLFTHQLPRVNQAIRPWLKEVVEDERFWDGEYDPSHTGTMAVRMPTPEERAAFAERYAAIPCPLFG